MVSDQLQPCLAMDTLKKYYMVRQLEFSLPAPLIPGIYAGFGNWQEQVMGISHNIKQFSTCITVILGLYLSDSDLF